MPKVEFVSKFTPDTESNRETTFIAKRNVSTLSCVASPQLFGTNRTAGMNDTDEVNRALLTPFEVLNIRNADKVISLHLNILVVRTLLDLGVWVKN